MVAAGRGLTSPRAMEAFGEFVIVAEVVARRRAPHAES